MTINFSDRTSNLLKACLRSGERAQQAYEAWRPYAVPDHLNGHELRLMSYLLENLEACGVKDERLTWIAGQTKYIWAANTVRMPELLSGVRSLKRGGMQFSLMKGAALMARWPSLMARRQMGDWDLLVARQDARGCLHQLQRIGWKSALPEYLTDVDLDRFHALAMGGKYQSQFDVHWRPTAGISDVRLTADVMKRSVAGVLGGESVSVISITDHLFVLFANAFYETTIDRADWVVEAATLLRRVEPDDWDWPLLRRLSKQYRLETWVEQCMRAISELSDTALPARALRPSMIAWTRPLQSREIKARGGDARGLVDLGARLNGIRARGISPIALSSSVRGPHDLLKQRPTGPLTSIKPEGIDLRRTPMGASLAEGWSIPEAAGRWSDGARAVIVLDAESLAADESVSVCLDFHTDANPQLAFTCWAGTDTRRWSFAEGHGATDQLTLEGKVITVSGRRVLPVVLEFEGLSDLQSRKKRGEYRALGIFLRRLTFTSDRYARTLEKPVYTNSLLANAVTFGGWSYPETAGRWSIGGQCSICFRSPFRQLVSIGLEIPQYFSADGKPKILNFNSGERHLGSVELSSGRAPISQGGYFKIGLPPEIQSGELMKIDISTDARMSPQQLGVLEDPRLLGFYLSRLDPIYES